MSSEGAGGMGEVYRAQDQRLGREVALKVLPEAFAHDPERRGRFEREARLLASLNHPNIATVHGLQEVGPHSFLEMEMVPGDTLTQIFARGPMTVRDALPIFQQIALALEAAHERGIIHRDLKPSNVKVMPEGRVKVLDFGLAKALTEDNPHASASVNRTTFELSATGMGVVLGTAAYMSPEQARGKPVDRRTDIWAFGSVLYEALTGTPPFRADTFSDTLVKVLTEEPDWSALTNCPPAVTKLLQRCLRKEPHSRLRDIADARLEIEEVLGSSELGRSAISLPAGATARRSLRLSTTVAVAVAAASVGLTAGWLIARSTAPAPAPAETARRLAVPLSASQRLVSDLAVPMAVTPDGSAIVYAATDGDTRTRLLLRRLDQFDATPIAGTDGASAPFFSPDGRWVGFHAAGALQKVSLAGGAPLRIAEAPTVWSASWGRDDTILFATALPGDGIWRVSAAGGQPERLTRPDPAKRELRHAAAQLLPDGRRALFSVLGADGWSAAILALDTKQVTPVPGRLGGAAQYVAGDRLVFAQDGGLVALSLDLERGTLGSSPVPMLERVATARLGFPFFAVSASGSLVYVPADRILPRRTLMTVDRDGRAVPMTHEPAAFAYPRFARDGRRLAVSIGT
ncbi:MAG: protein kinase, partial [Acidobacteria bacterium]|nr:protein kinase [Acidobacteriota bacterium]